jgi:glycine/D-amino acid oxidase-like deaminating enzyme
MPNYAKLVSCFQSLPDPAEESHVLSPSEVKKVHPLLRVDDIYGGVYSPGDGTIDPTSICNAYAKAAKKYGGGVYENVAATWTEIILHLDDILYDIRSDIRCIIS